MALSLALENRNFERDLAAFAHDDDRRRAADGGIGDEAHEVAGIDHVLPVEGDDDVAGSSPAW